jgi:hypothetical protein
MYVVLILQAKLSWRKHVKQRISTADSSSWLRRLTSARIVNWLVAVNTAGQDLNQVPSQYKSSAVLHLKLLHNGIYKHILHITTVKI